MSEVMPQSVAIKLFKAQGMLDYVIKEGQVTGFASYKYAKAEDFFKAVKEVAQQVGLIVVISHHDPVYAQLEIPNKNGGAPRIETHARIQTSITLIDSETGESWTSPGYYMGEGADSGDKAPYKAQTGAAKYAMAGMFLIATTDDPEKFDGQEEKPPKQTGRKVVDTGDKKVTTPLKDFSSWSAMYGYVDSLTNGKELREKAREVNKNKDKTPQQVAEALGL